MFIGRFQLCVCATFPRRLIGRRSSGQHRAQRRPREPVAVVGAGDCRGPAVRVVSASDSLRRPSGDERDSGRCGGGRR